MGYYVGIDLHANNCYLAVVGEDQRRVMAKRLGNHLPEILLLLSSLSEDVVGIAVESTYNWYWLVDGLMDAGYRVHLANPSAIKKYTGLKHADDRHDAFWLGQMLLLGILPEGYIYPKERRGVRDHCRKRIRLVEHRTALLNSLQHMICNHSGIKVPSHELKQAGSCEEWGRFLIDGVSLRSATLFKETIDFLSRQIQQFEKHVEALVKDDPTYQALLTIPGVGHILGSTILLETGPISRFAHTGDYASYCRRVPSGWLSNGKIKGHGNQKNGNPYLAWAFSEAATHARRHNQTCRRVFDRKWKKKSIFPVAQGALSHKLARAAYVIMRDQVPFDEAKLLA